MKIRYKNKNYLKIDKQEHLGFYEFYIDEIMLNKNYNHIPNDERLMIISQKEYDYLVSISWSLNKGYMPDWIITTDDKNLNSENREDLKYLGLYRKKL